MICTNDAASQLVKTIEVEASIKQAALLMEQHNIGFLPVLRGTHLVGVITDRDIAIRAGHFSLPFSEIRVEEAMTPRIVTVSDTASIAYAAELMAKYAVRRLVVVQSSGRLCAVLSLDDLAVYTEGDRTVGQILQKIIKPSSQMHIGIDHGGDAPVEVRFNHDRLARAA